MAGFEPTLCAQDLIRSKPLHYITTDAPGSQFNDYSILSAKYYVTVQKKSSLDPAEILKNLSSNCPHCSSTQTDNDENISKWGLTFKIKNSSMYALALAKQITNYGDIEKNPGPAKRKGSSLSRQTAKVAKQARQRRSQSASTTIEPEPKPSNTGNIFQREACHYCKARRFPNEPAGFCCDHGKLASLPLPPEIPQKLKDAYDCPEFLDNIRTYNNVFALASLGCKEIRETGYSPVVKIHGKVHHFVGSLIPNASENPKYAQLYFYDPQHELKNRMQLSSTLKENLVQDIQSCLHECNPFVKEICKAVDLGCRDDLSIKLKSDGTKTTELPTTDSVAGVLQNPTGGHMEIVFQSKNGSLKKIHELHRSYDPLHYVVLFPHGTDGYHLNIKNSTGKSVSALSYYRYLLQIRNDHQNLLLHSRRLSQQYAIDQFCKIETSRLNWHLYNQKKLRAEKYQGLIDSVNSGDNFSPGKRVILPPTFYGSPRWYVEAFNDAMSIVRKYGKPDLFITLTCNPKWPEITESLKPGEKPDDRPDLCVRVFNQKMKQLIKVLTRDHILGRTVAFTCMKEDQKRGLPHCHLLLIMHNDSKLRRPDDVDRIISAELPDKTKFPELHEIISQNMIHGPCMGINSKRPCVKDRQGQQKCAKGFPKPFNNQATTLSDNTYPNYIRRDPAHGGQTIQRTVNGKVYVIDNRWVVPYCPKLSYMFNAHVNVEIVVTVKAVKYLYKYITKGSDKILFAVQPDGVLNEIANFAAARFISATEAFWRIYGFEIMKRYPPVTKLALHLPDQQSVLFEEPDMQEIIDQGPPSTTLTEYFALNRTDPGARQTLYPDICQEYRFVSGKWQRRKNHQSNSNEGPASDMIGRIPIISLSPKQSELYYLRVLLYHVPGATDFEDLKMVNNVKLPSFQDACRERGLLSDDSAMNTAVGEASAFAFGSHLREFFAAALAHGSPGDPTGLWENHKDALSEDIARARGRPGLPEAADYAVALHEIQDYLNNLELDLFQHFGILIPNVPSSALNFDSIACPQVDTESLNALASESYHNMTEEQKNVYNQIMMSVDETLGQCFALNAAGGTGKTFVLTAIIAKIRSRNEVAVAAAISGIASILLPRGRTLHSKLKVPIDVDDYTTCNISRNSVLAQEIRKCKILIIDEITMANKQIFEAVDRSLRDIKENNKLFGGVTAVLSGDWRQILPVIKHGSKAEIVGACLKQSFIWKKVIKLKLSKNMRLTSMDDSKKESEFAQYLLDIGDGLVAPLSVDEPEYIPVPEHFLLPENDLQHLCDFVYEDMEHQHADQDWLCDKAILTVTNSAAENVNTVLNQRFPGPDNIKLSADVILDEDLARCYPSEFFNSLTPSGMPPHSLNLKTGAPIMLIRNLDAVKGHCNGSRYIVVQCHQHVLEARVATGLNIGTTKLIPRIPITCNDKDLPFSFKRTQFPVKTCFAMTINKSQGQTLGKVGLYLEQDVFAHGQLYVAMSRVRNPNNLRIVYPVDNMKTIRNVVYKEVL